MAVAGCAPRGWAQEPVQQEAVTKEAGDNSLIFSGSLPWTWRMERDFAPIRSQVVSQWLTFEMNPLHLQVALYLTISLLVKTK